VHILDLNKTLEDIELERIQSKILFLGATSEICSELVRLYADEEGETLLLHGRDAKALQELVKSIKCDPRTTIIALDEIDLTNVEEYSKWMDKVQAEYGLPEILVIAVAAWAEDLEINCLVPIHITQDFLRRSSELPAQQDRQIVFFGSVAGEDPETMHRYYKVPLLYACGKQIVNWYFQKLRREYANQPIKFQIAKIGPVKTKLYANGSAFFEENWLLNKLATSSAEVAEVIYAGISLKAEDFWAPSFWKFIMRSRSPIRYFNQKIDALLTSKSMRQVFEFFNKVLRMIMQIFRDL